MSESLKYVYVGVKCEVAGQEYVLGSTAVLTAEQLTDMDSCRTYFVRQSDFNSLFGPEDRVFLSPSFIGVWPVMFVEKLEKARDIVRARRQGA